jgi:hypothetical protein
MAWSGGTFTRANPTWASDAAGMIGIEPGRHDMQDNDFTTGINQCINKDGSNSFTANPNLGGFRPTNIAAGTAAAPALCVNNDTNTGVFGPAADTWAVATNGVERLRVDSTGKVGINCTPTEYISVLAPASTTAAISLRGNNVASTSEFVLIQATDGATTYVYNRANGPMIFGTNSTENMQIDSGGAKRFKNGYHYYEASAITSGAGTNALKYHTSTGLVTWDTSSRLIKDNIENCPLGLAAVLALKPRKYFRTDDQKNEVGFIADEVEQVVPEVVSYAQKSRFTGNEQDTEIVPSAVAYEKLTAVLCKAIQELNAKVTALENQLSATTVLP